jgi:hypothetical protein
MEDDPSLRNYSAYKIRFYVLISYSYCKQMCEGFLCTLNICFSSLYACFYQSYQNFDTNNVTRSWNTYICLCLLPNSSIIHFKLSINWPAAVILSTFNWKYWGKKLNFNYNSLFPPLSLHILTMLWLECCSSRVEPSFLLLSSLCSDKWLVTWVVNGPKFHVDWTTITIH